MTLFIDASALVAILAREPEAGIFARCLPTYAERLISLVAIWETGRALARIRGIDFAEARMIVANFLRAANIRVVPIDVAESEAALDAPENFGKGRHPANLNMGDFFTYACVRAHNSALLFKGDDFAQTDVKWAV